MHDQWLTIVEYARACNVSDMTVRRRIRNGKLNAILRDGKYLILFNPRGGQPNSQSGATEGASMLPQATAELQSYASRDTGVVKGHPSAHTTLYQELNAPMPASYPGEDSTYVPTVQRKVVDLHTSAIIPKAVTVPVAKQVTVSVEAASLIEFCENMIRRLDRSEEKIRKELHAREAELTAKLQAKDLEINQLKQQVEDLQLLVSIIDRSKA